MGDIWDVINTGITQAGNILGTRYSVPQLNPGQYIQTQQGVMYQLGPNQSTGLFPGASSLGSSNSGILLLAGGALLLVMLIKR